jgi:hypothetical protein
MLVPLKLYFVNLWCILTSHTSVIKQVYSNNLHISITKQGNSSGKSLIYIRDVSSSNLCRKAAPSELLVYLVSPGKLLGNTFDTP